MGRFLPGARGPLVAHLSFSEDASMLNPAKGLQKEPLWSAQQRSHETCWLVLAIHLCLTSLQKASRIRQEHVQESECQQ